MIESRGFNSAGHDKATRTSIFSPSADGLWGKRADQRKTPTDLVGRKRARELDKAAEEFLKVYQYEREGQGKTLMGVKVDALVKLSNHTYEPFTIDTKTLQLDERDKRNFVKFLNTDFAKAYLEIDDRTTIGKILWSIVRRNQLEDLKPSG
jgi:hypothetical protein